MVTVQELMAGMAIASGNDACVAVAEYLGGGVAPFVERMNRKARFLGMTQQLVRESSWASRKGAIDHGT